MNGSRDTWNNIWVISDTHLKSGENLPDSFVRRLSREDLIIHLGDFISFDVVHFLENAASLAAVSGNCDSIDIKRYFPPQKILAIGAFSIAMTHGRGGLGENLAAIRREYENKVDIVLFGHTHMPYQSKFGRTLFVNPGSLTQGRGNGTGFVRLHLDSEIKAEYLEL